MAILELFGLASGDGEVRMEKSDSVHRCLEFRSGVFIVD